MYNEKFQNIIDDGEVTEDILNIVIKKIGDVSNLNALSSNGSSFVFITSERENVYQYFNYQNIVLNIVNIVKKIKENNIIKFYLNDFNFEINLNNYICEFISYEPKNIIIWKKHLCLNSFNDDKKREFIIKNILKLTWDIIKCLYALHENNIYHGDPTIDNIGILNNNFILFDFDGSREIKQYEKYDLSKNDIYKFINSIKFNTNNNKIIEQYLYINKTSFEYLLNIIGNDELSDKESIEYLNNLKIIY